MVVGQTFGVMELYRPLVERDHELHILDHLHALLILGHVCVICLGAKIHRGVRGFFEETRKATDTWYGTSEKERESARNFRLHRRG